MVQIEIREYMIMKTIVQGRLSHKLRSMAVSAACLCRVALGRVLGRPLVKGWPFLFEYGTRYTRAQFNHAFRISHDITESRAYFDSVYGMTETYPDVDVRKTGDGEPRGTWFLPQVRHSDATLLHFHGGGYTFYAGVSRHFAVCLAHTLGVAVFAPDYRLTPEHPHPAQLDDGLAAYAYVLEHGTPPEKLVLCGDSAGGHLALMVLARLRDANLPPPALTVGISPWTDIGRRGASQFGNDPYDLVQGYMTLEFARWLKGGQALSDAALSPIGQDYRSLGPIYLQAGGAGNPGRHDPRFREHGRRPRRQYPSRCLAANESRVPRLRRLPARKPRSPGLPAPGRRGTCRAKGPLRPERGNGARDLAPASRGSEECRIPNVPYRASAKRPLGDRPNAGKCQ